MTLTRVEVAHVAVTVTYADGRVQVVDVPTPENMEVTVEDGLPKSRWMSDPYPPSRPTLLTLAIRPDWDAGWTETLQEPQPGDVTDGDMPPAAKSAPDHAACCLRGDLDATSKRLQEVREALAAEEGRRRLAEAAAERARRDADDLEDVITSARAKHEEVLGRAERVRRLAEQHLADTRPTAGRRPVLGDLAGGPAVAHLAELVLAELGHQPQPARLLSPGARVAAAWPDVLEAVKARSRVTWMTLLGCEPEVDDDGAARLRFPGSASFSDRPRGGLELAAALGDVLGGGWSIDLGGGFGDIVIRVRLMPSAAPAPLTPDTVREAAEKAFRAHWQPAVQFVPPPWPGIEPKEHGPRPWTTKETPADDEPSNLAGIPIVTSESVPPDAVHLVFVPGHDEHGRPHFHALFNAGQPAAEHSLVETQETEA